MKLNWHLREILRFPEAETGGGGDAETPKSETFKINGKDVDPQTAAAALNLYNAMQDDITGKEIVGTLAKRMGLLDKEGEIKNPTKAAEKLEGRLTKMLKQKLGKEYEKFSDEVGGVMDEAIQSYLEEFAGKQQSEIHATGWEAEVENFMSTHEIDADIEAKMQEVITRNGGIPRGLKGSAAQEYLDDMYELSIKKLGINKPPDTEKPRRRTRRAAEDDFPDFREVDRPKNPTIDQIIDAAMRGQRFKQ